MTRPLSNIRRQSRLETTRRPPRSNRVVADEDMQRAKEIIRSIAEKHGVSPAQILSKDRSASIVAARQEAMYEVYRLTDMSMPKVGRLFNRDHTTVLWAIERVQEALDKHGSWMKRDAGDAARRRSAQFRNQQKIAQQLNDFWQGLGASINAEVVFRHGRYVVKSSLPPKALGLEAVE